MKRISLLLAFILFLCISVSYGQNGKRYEDAVYLNNGAVVRGVITERVTDEYVVITAHNGYSFRFNIDEIYRIQRDRIIKPASAPDLTRGYMTYFDLGYGVGVGEWPAERFTVSILGGYKFNHMFSVGAGFSYTNFDYSYIGSYNSTRYKMQTGIAVLAQGRITPYTGNATPFLSLTVGYQIPSDREVLVFEGLSLEPVIGIALKNSPYSRITLGVGYILNRAEYVSNWDTSLQGKTSANAINFRLGFFF